MRPAELGLRPATLSKQCLTPYCSPGVNCTQKAGTEMKSLTIGHFIFPNVVNLLPGRRVNFWTYDPKIKGGWFIYGQGTVTTDGKQIVPEPGVVKKGQIRRMTRFCFSAAQVTDLRQKPRSRTWRLVKIATASIFPNT